MHLSERIGNKLRGWSLYLFACYRSTGGRLTHIASDWREVHLRIPLSRGTRN